MSSWFPPRTPLGNPYRGFRTPLLSASALGSCSSPALVLFSEFSLKVRLSEHRQAVKRGDPKNGIAVHVQKTNHCINWEGATVQRRAEGFWLRRTVEAIQIRKATPNMNLDSGLLLPMVWNPILNPHPIPQSTPLTPHLASFLFSFSVLSPYL